MDNHERLHRPDLKRSEPTRNSATYFRDSTASVNDLGQSGDNGTSEGIVAYGVRLGYQVIEEQIREGQRLAQRLRPPTATSSDDLSPLVGRVLHLYKDLGALCLDAVEALAHSPATRSGLSRAGEEGQEQSHETGMSGGTEYGIEIFSPFRTHVTLKLFECFPNSAPRVHALYASDPNIHPLTGVRFNISPESLIPTLFVDIADAQCPATYTGVVVDAVTNEPCGTLCVRLSA